MPITGKWIFTAAMDVDADKEALFNEITPGTLERNGMCSVS